MKGKTMSATLQTVSSGALIGTVLPLLTAIVQRPAWSAPYKKIVAVAAAVVAGVLTVAVEGSWSQFAYGKLTLATILAVLAASQTTYDLLWKPTKIAPAIEALTTKNRPQRVE
ncbi:hypothetical protein [Streptomyces sp. NPDC046976]|uniref:hypothetical protein n=1 Tax=Streptomyces sp. NPDC046976 TaxID=3155258 RepID=UPI0033D8AD37